MSTSHRARFAIAASHPSLPGHFPGEPVVPGVVVLDQVIDAAQTWLGHALSPRALTQVKFLSPLLPDEAAEIALELDGASFRFRVDAAGRAIAQGSAVLDLPAP